MSGDKWSPGPDKWAMVISPDSQVNNWNGCTCSWQDPHIDYLTCEVSQSLDDRKDPVESYRTVPLNSNIRSEVILNSRNFEIR